MAGDAVCKRSERWLHSRRRDTKNNSVNTSLCVFVVFVDAVRTRTS